LRITIGSGAIRKEHFRLSWTRCCAIALDKNRWLGPQTLSPVASDVSDFDHYEIGRAGEHPSSAGEEVRNNKRLCPTPSPRSRALRGARIAGRAAAA
jgi:hypothetical protein